MSKKLPNDKRGFVYSTDPNFKFEPEESAAQETLLPQAQKLKVKLETKHRAGKAVTLVDGFVGSETDAALLGKNLKNTCGTGGSVKGMEIIIQGDQREKVVQWLLKNGYKNTKKL